MALAGGLLRAGWEAEGVEDLVREVCGSAGDDRVERRVADVHDTAKTLKADPNAKVTGWPRLVKLLGDDVVRRARAVLGLVITVEVLAAAKKLPPGFLRELGVHDLDDGSGVGIPYRDMAGRVAAVKRRTALRATDGSYWPKDTPLAAYGEDRLRDAVQAGCLTIAEGETDPWCCWWAGIPALGLPGSGTPEKVLQPEHVRGIPTVYVVQETDDAGKTFVRGVAGKIALFGLGTVVKVLRMPSGIKDPADLYAVDPAQFAARMRQAMDDAEDAPLDATYPDGDPWPDPIPLGDLPPVPSFPTDALVEWQRNWVEAQALALQVPPDLPALLALAATAAGIARKVRVRAREGWFEPTNLFTLTALPPGERKSAAFTAALAPVCDLERELREEARPVVAVAESACRLLEARLKRATLQAAKAEDPEERQTLATAAAELAQELAACEVPSLPQAFTDDETPESLGKLLAEQGGRMLVAAPEGTVLEIVKGRYSESANFDVFLKGHAGDPLRTGRVSRGRSIVDRPALSVALSVQPDVVRGLAADASLKGRGFLARFLYGIPHSNVGSRETAPPAAPEVVLNAYAAGIRAAWAMEYAEVRDGNDPVPHVLHLDRDAEQELAAFERWLEPQLHPDGTLASLAGWANKLAGAAVRIAGTLYVAAGRPLDGRISAETLRAAVRLCREYFLPHACAAFMLMGADPRTAPARRIWSWVRREGRTEFKRWEAHKDLKSEGVFPTPDSLDKPLDLLCQHNLLRAKGPEARTGPGRPPATVFEVNPRAISHLPDLPDSPDGLRVWEGEIE